MRQPRRCVVLVATFLCSMLPAHWGQAHVELGAPGGGEALVGGANFTIEWRPAVATHDTLNFDLWYSTTAASGPWTTIAADLPPGSTQVGSLHTFAWTVPSITDASVWVRVRQENGNDPDYEDVSGSFSIAAAGLTGDYNHDDTVDAADYTVWRNALGNPNAGLDADGNRNGQIDTGDYGAWKMHYGESSGGAAGAILAPEPPIAAILAAAAMGLVGAMPNRSRRLRHRAQ